MGLATAITHAPERHLDDLVAYMTSEFAIGSLNSDEKFDKADPGEVVSALKAWAYMHINDGSQGE